jgi:uncharacterized protein
MRLVGGELQLSASDLVGHLGCRHRTALDLACARGTRQAPPVYPDPVAELLRERGFAHEAAYVASLGADEVVRVSAENGRAAAAATAAAMQRGVAVIVQGTLAAGRWSGRTDVLKRVAGTSAFGSWAYEVIDTKLASETRAATILQLCLYSDLLAAQQAARPAYFHVVSPGDGDFRCETFRLTEYEAYYRHVRRRLESWQAVATYPDPVEHCDLCRWWQSCDRQRRDDDSVWLVAGVSRRQKRELEAAGIVTLERLAAAPELPRPARGSPEALARTQLQARMQRDGRRSGRPVYELLPAEQGRGLCLLPEPSPGDVFLDLEGDRMGVTSGREFLFGLVWQDDAGAVAYCGLWATSAAEERRAFERCIDAIAARLARWPDMHVYHYAPYEPAALKRLMGRHETREEELDELLRGGRFVDLCTVVRQSLRASVERYSLKDLEPFHGYRRSGELRAAAACVRAVRVALGAGEPAAIDAVTRTRVETYNREDCESTRSLRHWLEALRAAQVAAGAALPRRAPRDGKPGEALDADRQAVRAAMQALAGDVAADASARDATQQGRWLLAQMLDYHRRERKVHWWERYRLAELSAEEALEERAALGGLVHLQTVSTSKQGIPVDRYQYPEQDHELAAGHTVHATGCERLGEVVAIDRARRTVDLKKSRRSAALHPAVLFRHDTIPLGEKPHALLRLGQHVATHGFAPDGARGTHEHAAASALLLRRPPRPALSPRPGELPLELATRVVLELDGDVLPIQGPPGTGKTYTAARMVVALVAAGKKVGVTATSHKVIRRLLDEVCAAASATQVALGCVQKVEDGDGPGPVRLLDDNDAVAAALADGSAQVAGGTSWLWSRAAMAASVDVLFVDEAGQMSLADTLAVAQAARSLVLVGDPRQLEQPQQGSHPQGTEVSALQHLLGDHLTVTEGHGLFLGETWRMAPGINQFTSELFYEGRLRTRADLGRQALVGPPPFVGAGLWYVPVEHQGNQNASDEEVAAVVWIADQLLHRDVGWSDRRGQRAALSGADILVVAPYNAQVDRLSAALGTRGLPVGTVDRFQGQEAPVVIYSTATSSPEDAPRGMEFLYSLNRLNVATSRARCACILVASPRLFEAECRTPHQVRLASAFCRYLELARTVTPPASTA